MTITKLVSNLHIILNDFPVINGECYVPYAKVFADGSFELIVTWNLKVNIFTIAFISNNWAIRVENVDDSFYSMLKVLQDWIETIPMSEVE